MVNHCSLQLVFRFIWASSKGEVLNCVRGVKISSLGCNWGTGSPLPGTVALSAKKVIEDVSLFLTLSDNLPRQPPHDL